jgi:hypothetical protein
MITISTTQGSTITFTSVGTLVIGGSVPEEHIVNLTVGINTIPHTLGRAATLLSAFEAGILTFIDWTAQIPDTTTDSIENIYVRSGLARTLTINIL